MLRVQVATPRHQPPESPHVRHSRVFDRAAHGFHGFDRRGMSRPPTGKLFTKTPSRYGRMTDILKPRDAKEVEDAVRWALGNDKALEVAGAGHQARHRPAEPDRSDARSRRGFPASRCTSRKNWCFRPRPARRSPRSRRCSKRTTSSSPSSRWTTARCLAAQPARAPSAAPSPPICPARAASRPARRATTFSA